MKSNVGSLCGTTGDDGTNVCLHFFSKKSMKALRTFAAVLKSLELAVEELEGPNSLSSAVRNCTQVPAGEIPMLFR
jgi:hypothetical protein